MRFGDENPREPDAYEPETTPTYARRQSVETLTNRNLSVMPGPSNANRSVAPTQWLKGQMARFSDGGVHARCNAVLRPASTGNELGLGAASRRR